MDALTTTLTVLDYAAVAVFAASGVLERDSFKWIPVEAPVTLKTYESEPVYPFQMIPSETDRLWWWLGSSGSRRPSWFGRGRSCSGGRCRGSEAGLSSNYRCHPGFGEAKDRDPSAGLA